MANTINVSVNAQYKIGTSNSTEPLLPSGQVSFTADNDGLGGGIQVIGTSAENIDFGALTAAGKAFFKNLDADNYVEVGFDNTGFVPIFYIEAGDIATLELNESITWQARANTASIDLYVKAAESNH